MLKFGTINIIFGLSLVLLLVADRMYDVSSFWYWLVGCIIRGYCVIWDGGSVSAIFHASNVPGHQVIQLRCAYI